MRKRIVIGDIHGHWDSFYNIYKKENPDDVILLGDYFDAFHVTDNDMVACFQNIIDLCVSHLSKSKSNSFIMIIGNHDYHYMDNVKEKYSGYRSSTAAFSRIKMMDLYNNGTLLFIYVDPFNKTIYSHAGVTNSWVNDNAKDCPLDLLTTLSLDKYKFTYKDGGDWYGSSKYSSPIWVRPASLLNDMYKDNEGNEWTQIVGHTIMDKPLVENNLYCIDTMPRFYIREILNDDLVLINREIVEA